MVESWGLRRLSATGQRQCRLDGMTDHGDWKKALRAMRARVSAAPWAVLLDVWNEREGHPSALIIAAVDLQHCANLAVATAVGQARREGLSWSEIAALFGVSKQAAWDRWADKTLKLDFSADEIRGEY